MTQREHRGSQLFPCTALSRSEADGGQWTTAGERVESGRDRHLLDLRPGESLGPVAELRQQRVGDGEVTQRRSGGEPGLQVGGEDVAPLGVGRQIDEEDLVEPALAQGLRREQRDGVRRGQPEPPGRASGRARV